MKIKIFVAILVVFVLSTTTIVGAVKTTKYLDNKNIVTSNTKFLDIAVADISAHQLRIIFSDGDGDYTTCQNHNAGGDPEKVISEDFNRDGLDDLAVINYYSGDLCILLQKEAGGFELHDQQYTGVGPKNLVSGYFDSDNYVDIAVITMGGEYVNQYSLVVFIGEGNGEFSKETSSPYTFNSLPHDLTTGDFNSDGALDIAVITDSIRIYLNKNTGAGDFEHHASISASGAWRITSGDFNNDGFCDLATTNPGIGAGTVSVFLGNPEEADLFEDDTVYPVHGALPNGITTGYFDNDDYLDIAVANGAYSRSVSVLMNNEGTGFKPYVTYSAGYKTACNIISGDVNKDGETDLVVVAMTDTESGGVSILFGNSDGTFTKNSLDNYRGSYWGVAIGEFGEWANKPPKTPTIAGPTQGEAGKEYIYTAVTTDPERDKIYYLFDWGNGEFSEWIGPYNSGQTVSTSHTWTAKGDYAIKVKAKDTNGLESDWATLEISMPKNKPAAKPLLLQFLRQHLCISPILRQLLIL